MQFNEILTLIRNIIRDVNADILFDYDIMAFWNTSCMNIFNKTGALETIRYWRYPAEFSHIYDWDWEKQFIENDGDILQFKSKGQNRGSIVDFDWEAGYWEDGPQEFLSAFDFPFEVNLYSSRGENPPIPLHSNFLEAKLVCFDEQVIYPIRETDLALSDGRYERKTGEPTHYYREDDYSNFFHIYPMPANNNEQAYDIETESFDVEEPSGVVIWDDEYLQLDENGLIVDSIDQEDGIVMIFKYYPTIIENLSDEIDMPFFFIKYCIYETIERIYKTSKDAADQKLAEYWKMRKETGLKVIQMYNSLKIFTDNNLRFRNVNGKSNARRLPVLDPSHFGRN